MLITNTQEHYQSEIILKHQEIIRSYDQFVTVKSGIVGDSTKFYPSIPGGESQSKAPFGDIPLIGGGIGEVTCNLTTKYAGDRVDKSNLAKTNLNGELVITTNTTAAINRGINAKIRAALDATTNEVAVASSGMTLDKIEAIWQNFTDYKYFENNEIPIIRVGTKQWIDLMGIDNFVKAETIGHTDMPYLFTKAETGRFFYDMVFKLDSNLPKVATSRKCFAFVKSAVGLAIGNENESMIERIPGKDVVMYWTKEKSGAVALDVNGVMEIACLEP